MKGDNTYEKSEIVQIINKSVENKNLCRVGYKYNDYLKYLFPLIANEKLFLASREYDFDFAGYRIGKFSDIDMVDVRTDGDRFFEIIKTEGLPKYFNIPFSKITCVEFNCRYCNVFSKHI